MLNENDIKIIKSSVPILQERGLEITKFFYKTMFENNPEVKPMFNMEKQNSGEQPLALANAIIAVAKNIDNLNALMPTVKCIGEKHVLANVKPEHYSIVGKNLLIAIKQVLADSATDDIMKAWENAYGVLAEIFIKVEKDIYSAN